MMRFLAVLMVTVLPGLAAGATEGPGEGAALPAACLDRVAEEQGRTIAAAEAMRRCIGQAANACMQAAGGDTTVGMVACLADETREWDMLMNAHYGKLMERVETADRQLADLGSAAPPAAPLLRQAQRDWIRFRDAGCEYESVKFQGGTAGGPAAGACMLEVTATQALRLMARVWETE